jgi:hypothetical protein
VRGSGSGGWEMVGGWKSRFRAEVGGGVRVDASGGDWGWAEEGLGLGFAFGVVGVDRERSW